MSSFIVPISGLPSVSSLQNTKQAGAGKAMEQAADSFSNLLQTAIENASETNETNQDQILGLALGENDDLHTGAIAALKSSVAINFTSSLASAAIRSYNELMRMQI